MSENNVKPKKKIYQKWWVWIMAIIVIIAGVYFIFGDEIKAKRMGIDVQYLENPKYCQVDSDCVNQNDCDSVNKFNYKDTGWGCKLSNCGFECRENKCTLLQGEDCKNE